MAEKGEEQGLKTMLEESKEGVEERDTVHCAQTPLHRAAQE